MDVYTHAHTHVHTRMHEWRLRHSLQKSISTGSKRGYRFYTTTPPSPTRFSLSIKTQCLRGPFPSSFIPPPPNPSHPHTLPE